MPREAKCRMVAFIPPVKAFQPVGVPPSNLEEVVLKVEEFEAIRLKSHLNLEQEECAQMMQVSRTTFQRILTEAYAKVADALSNGKGIRIEGGSYCLGQGYCRRRESKLGHLEDCEFYDAGLELDQALASGNIKNNKIAFCSVGTTSSDFIHERFGHCPYFLIWDPDTHRYTILENSKAAIDQGSGTSSSQQLIQAGVGAIIVNRIGPKALMVLQRANIHVYTGAEGKSIEEALKMFEAQELTKLETANY